MKTALSSLACLTLGLAPGAQATILLYDNTTTDTLDLVPYSNGPTNSIGSPYTALGDQIQLASAGTATQALVQMYNAGDPGTFDAELDFWTPVGSFLGSYDSLGNISIGGDVINLTFDLATGLALPQNVVFTVSVSNLSASLNLGLDMFEPPTTGSSDNTFMIAETAGTAFFQIDTNNENVYFQLSGTGSAAAPEISTSMLLGTGLLALGFAALLRRSRQA